MKFFKYSFISLIGLISATVIFYTLKITINLNAYYSNIIGDGFALVLVYLFSWHFIFEHSKKKFKRKFIFNLISKILVIYFLSLLLWIFEIKLLYPTFFLLNEKISLEIIISVVKICLAPLSLIMNYFATYLIVEYHSKNNINKIS